jgi:IclR family KDG regulon transcriptional repressor
MPKGQSDGERAAGEGGGVRAVARAIAILNAFRQGGSLALAQVARAAALDKATARRILLTLMSDRFVTQDIVTQRYALGGAVRTLAASVPESPDLRAAAKPVLVGLAAELQMTVFLSVYRDGRAVCLERFHDMHGLEVRWWAVGGSMPLNCGGAPKLLLAYQGDDEIDRLLASPLPAMTPKSITDPGILKDRLLRIRRQGWEFAIDDVALGLSALAVPILDEEGALLCAVSLGGLTPQMSERGKPFHLDRLRSAAEAISRHL